jgi:Tfp pilus assembly protein PilV
MKLNLDRITNKHKESEQGFSLIETAIALTTLGVCLAYAMPLFLYAKMNNSKSEIRTGALIVSQRIFDDIRSKSFQSMPLNDPKIKNWPEVAASGGNPAISANPEFKPNPANLDPNILAQEKLLTTAMGREYQTKVIYCEGYSADSTVCNDNSRKFKVEVSFNGSKVYDLEGTYTNFQ